MKKRTTYAILGCLAAYLLSFGPVWAHYIVKNQPAPKIVASFYKPCTASLGKPLSHLNPLLWYMVAWEMAMGGH